MQSNAGLRDLMLNNGECRRPLFLSPFSEDFAFVTLSVRNSVQHRLHPEETRILSPRASASRRSEFLLGRTAAYLALKQLGFDSPPPVLQGERREPLWPEGIVGSITHCESWAIVAAARRRERLIMVFSAKEAAFKALYPLRKRLIDFKEVRLRCIPKQAGFRGELLTSLNPDFTRGYEFDVGCHRNGDMILTHMVLLC